MKINQNLIPNIVITTGGTEYTTGRTIDGEIEYGKRYLFNTNFQNQDFTINTGLNMSNITLTKIDGVETSTNTGNYWNVNIGDTKGSTLFAQTLKMSSTGDLILSANGNFNKTYVEINYIYN